MDRLSEDGLVVRRPGSDGRVVLVALTARGRRVARSVLAARAAAVSALLAPLSAKERSTLHDLVAKLVAGGVDERLAMRRAGAVPAGGWLCRLCDVDACGRGDGDCPAARAAAIDVERLR